MYGGRPFPLGGPLCRVREEVLCAEQDQRSGLEGTFFMVTGYGRRILKEDGMNSDGWKLYRNKVRGSWHGLTAVRGTHETAGNNSQLEWY